MSRPALILTLLVLLIASVSTAQLLGTEAGTMFYPSPLTSGAFKTAAGVTLMTPPPNVVEEFASVLRAPLFEFQVLYGLPYSFQLEGRVTTILVSNHLSLGAKYIVPHGPYGFSAGVDLAYWFGKLDIDGFDNRVKGWNLYPSLAAGYDFGAFAVTVKGELNIILTKSQRVGDIVIADDENVFNGGAFSVYIEQPLWKDNYLTLGLKNNFVKFYYAVWPGFPTFDRFSYIPEFYIGFRL
jgi:hypothetical protein